MEEKKLLLLHGALGASSQFLPLIDRLKDKSDIDIHVLDFEGHGTSPLRARTFRIDYFAENVIAYIDSNSLESVHIFGHSMGGHIGLYLAHFFPERVAGVFTLGTKFRWSPQIAEKENQLLDPVKMKAKVPHFVETLRQRHTAAGWEILLEKIKDQNIFQGRHAPLTDDILSQIKQRVRIGLGDRDKMVGLDETIEAFFLLPNAELQILPATPHPLERVPVARLAWAIMDFLSPGQ